MNPEPTFEENPYAPPQASLISGEETISEYEPASQGKRFANYLIDQVATIGLIFLLAFVIGALDAMEITGGLADRLFGERSGLVGNLIGILVGMIYYLVFEGLWGRTLGKLITGTAAVHSRTGGRIGFGALLGRTLARFVPFEAFSFLGSEASGWHDKWSGTKVVDLKKPAEKRVPPPVGVRFYPGR